MKTTDIIDCLNFCCDDSTDCTGCKRWNISVENNSCVNDLMQKAAIELTTKLFEKDELKRKLEEEKNRKNWISVKEALPTRYKEIDGEKYYKEVAVRVKNLMHSKIAYYDPEAGCWYGTDFFPIRGITHWCELPDWE